MGLPVCSLCKDVLHCWRLKRGHTWSRLSLKCRRGQTSSETNGRSSEILLSPTANVIRLASMVLRADEAEFSLLSTPTPIHPPVLFATGIQQTVKGHGVVCSRRRSCPRTYRFHSLCSVARVVWRSCVALSRPRTACVCADDVRSVKAGSRRTSVTRQSRFRIVCIGVCVRAPFPVPFDTTVLQFAKPVESTSFLPVYLF